MPRPLTPLEGNARPLASGVKIGHVHLKVADLERAMAFYCGVLGFQLTQRFGTGAAFISAGGYHHHIGANVWRSYGAGARDEKMNGLDDLAFSVSEPLMDGLRRRLVEGRPA